MEVCSVLRYMELILWSCEGSFGAECYEGERLLDEVLTSKRTVKQWPPQICNYVKFICSSLRHCYSLCRILVFDTQNRKLFHVLWLRTQSNCSLQTRSSRSVRDSLPGELSTCNCMPEVKACTVADTGLVLKTYKKISGTDVTLDDLASPISRPGCYLLQQSRLNQFYHEGHNVGCTSLPLQTQLADSLVPLCKWIAS